MMDGGLCFACKTYGFSDISIGRKRFVELVKCACGCGTEFNKFDDRNRPRKFLDRSHRDGWRSKKVLEEMDELSLQTLPRKA
jgi:hypothetical protein